MFKKLSKYFLTPILTLIISFALIYQPAPCYSGLAEDIIRISESTQKIYNFVHGTPGTVETDGGKIINLAMAAQLADEKVDQLSIFNPRGMWATATAYVFRDLVEYDSAIYMVLSDHTSGVFADDLSADKLAIYQDTKATSALITSLANALEGDGVDLVARAKKYVSEVDDLNTTSPGTHTIVYARCFATIGDGGHGDFEWDAVSTATPIRGMIHQVVGNPTGRWIRQFDRLYANYFGAIGNNSTINTTSLQAALNYAGATTKELHIKAGVYLAGKLDWPSNNIKFIGEGSAMGYTSGSDPKTVLKAVAGTTTVLDLIQTGTGQDREGNVIQDIMIDGNNIANVGIGVTLATLIQRCKITRCTTAGIRTSIICNSLIVDQCHLYSNSGYGMYVQGPSSTILFITRSYIGLNTAGGIYAEGGTGSVVRDCVIESNAGFGFRIYKNNSNTNYLGDWTFEDSWLEDNAATPGTAVIEIDAGFTDVLYAPRNIKFTNCHMSCGDGRKLANFRVANGVTFNHCTMQGADPTDTTLIAVTACIDVRFLNTRNYFTYSAGPGLSEAQELAFMAISGGGKLGNYFHDKGYIHATGPNYKIRVGVGTDAPTFENSWINVASQTETAFWYTEDGELRIQGCVSGGVSGTVVFTLPAGYRPAVDKRFTIDSNAGYGYIDIAATTGTVTITGTGAGTRSTFDTIISVMR